MSKKFIFIFAVVCAMCAACSSDDKAIKAEDVVDVEMPWRIVLSDNNYNVWTDQEEDEVTSSQNVIFLNADNSYGYTRQPSGYDGTWTLSGHKLTFTTAATKRSFSMNIVSLEDGKYRYTYMEVKGRTADGKTFSYLLQKVPK